MHPVRSEVKEDVKMSIINQQSRLKRDLVMAVVSTELDFPAARAVNQPLVPLLRKLKFHGTR